MHLKCPECGRLVKMLLRESDNVEMHGLDSGPFEHFYDEWWECPLCFARFTDRELTEVAF